MNKPVLGLLLGGILGVFDGLSALISAPGDPNVQAGIVGIVVGSTFKGLLAGVLIGWFARRVRSVPKGVAFGLFIGALFAFMIAAIPQPDGKHYYWQIVLPGSVLGLIVGYATQKYGARPRQAQTV
jgi:peptidoglycan/LPS O-acetylase OafA/YrhL